MSTATIKSSKTRKIALSVAAASFAAALIGVGAYATWSATVTEDQSVSAGDVDLAFGTNDLTIAASDIAPGDTIRRRVSLTNSGSLEQAAVDLTSSAAGAPQTMFTDTTDGLQLSVYSCGATAWTGPAPYTCASPTTVYTGPASIGAPASIVSNFAAAATDNLLFELTLPGSAPDTMESESVTITYTFTGTQRAGTQK